MLCPSPEHVLLDRKRRPYFLWDEPETTLEEFLVRLREHPDPETRDYYLGKLLRQAKPDDALQFVTPRQIADRWDHIERNLGRQREFWAWLLETWARLGHVHR